MQKFSKVAVDSAQFDTARSSEKYEYLDENATKNKNILTHWSVAQTSSNDEKKLEVENLDGLSI